MIIIFHSLYNIAKFLLKYYQRRKVLQEFIQNQLECQEIAAEEMNGASLATENQLESLSVLKFDPPVYLQRYVDTQQTLLDERWASGISRIVEFGCAELRLFTYLKRLIYVKEILHIDIDEELLKDSLFRIEPLTVDHLIQRPSQLSVAVYAGSVSDPDYRLRGADAVVAIELIEHLYPDTLDALPYNIFAYINPKIVIFTTPNADFNVLFPNFVEKRHWDHKFEWTRAQFQDWCYNITTRFPQYSVTFQGCGSGPAGTEHYGSCSQMAVFTKEYNCVDSEVPSDCCQVAAAPNIATTPESNNSSYGICTYYSYSQVLELMSSTVPNAPDTSVTTVVTEEVAQAEVTPPANNFYRLVHKIDYPYYPDTRAPDEIKLDDAKYLIHQARMYSYRYQVDEPDRLEIPIYNLVSNEHGPFSTVPEMKKLLTNAGYVIEECVCGEAGTTSACVIQYLDMDSKRTTTTDASDLSDDLPNEDEEEDGQIGASQRDNLDDVQYYHRCDGWEVEEDEEDWDVPKEQDNPPLPPSLHLETINTSATTAITTTSITTEYKSSPPGRDTSSDQLVDSGYQKSISTAEWSPQSPLLDGMFEEQFNSCGRSEEQESAGREVEEKRVFKCSLIGGGGSVGEKDVVGVKASVGGGKKAKIETKDALILQKKPHHKSTDSIDEPARELSECLVLNALNQTPDTSSNLMRTSGSKLKPPSLPIIQPLSFPASSGLEEPEREEPDAPAVIQPVAAAPQVAQPAVVAQQQAVVAQQQAVVVQQQAVLEPLLVDVGVVENGDLANNNRDLEGNNYPDHEVVVLADRELHELEDDLNENIENHVDAAIIALFPIFPQHNNHQEQLEIANHNQDIENRNDVQNMPERNQQVLVPVQAEVHEPPPLQVEPRPHILRLAGQVNHDAPGAGAASPELAEVHRASREALFDSDSQIDLLEDMNIPEDIPEDDAPPNILLLAVNNYDDGIVMDDPFPHWLLQMLGDDGDQRDEPHFYCQGDGVGVHPPLADDVEDEQSTSSDITTSEDEAEAAEQPAAAASGASLASGIDAVAMPSMEVVGVSVGYPPTPFAPPNSLISSPQTLSGRTSYVSVNADSADEQYFDTEEDPPPATAPPASHSPSPLLPPSTTPAAYNANSHLCGTACSFGTSDGSVSTVSFPPEDEPGTADASKGAGAESKEP